MILNNSQKALAITLLVAGTLVLSVINVSVFKMNPVIAETFYEIEKIEEEPETEDLQQKDNTKSTNKAYNKTENYKHYAKAYKAIAPPKDYANPKLETYKNRVESKTSSTKSKGSSAISEETLTDFNSVNSVLSKQSKSKSATQSNVANTNSSIYYSLKDRTDNYLPIPIYLCNAQGKIVINITVNQNGKVVSTSVNSSSTSSNACLQEHALDYAKEARFNSASKQKQIGTITFVFTGK